MLKHVQISPLRNRSDSVSLRSSTSCASSMCGSPEPLTELQRTPSRASSYSSLNEQLPQTTIKVYTNCLKIDIEYKTLGIQWDTTSKGVITQLLRRLKMRHRDPRLFYLSMEVSVRRAGVKTILVLDDDTRPAILQACHPAGESRFCLQLKPGGLIRVHTSALQPSSQYKSLVISEETTSDELLQLLLSCYNSIEPVEQFSIYEVCPGQEYQRKLHPDDIPLRAQAERMKRGENCHFLVRRNPNYAIRRRQLLTSLDDVVHNFKAAGNVTPFDGNSSISTIDDVDGSSLLDMSIESLSDDLRSLMTNISDEDEDGASSTTSGSSSDTSSEGSTNVRRTPSTLTIVTPIKSVTATNDANTTMATTTTAAAATTAAINNNLREICLKCRNNFKSCDFCHKTAATATTTGTATTKLQRQTSTVSNKSITPRTYNPVYNIREIRTAQHSFSSLGNDKKLLDIQMNGRFDPTTCRMRPQSVYFGRYVAMTPIMTLMDLKANTKTTTTTTTTTTGTATAIGTATTTATTTKTKTNNNVATNNVDFNSNNSTTATTATKTTTLEAEAVNNNPAKGLGHFVYL